jgi:hypothetical protein
VVEAGEGGFRSRGGSEDLLLPPLPSVPPAGDQQLTRARMRESELTYFHTRRRVQVTRRREPARTRAIFVPNA